MRRLLFGLAIVGLVAGWRAVRPREARKVQPTPSGPSDSHPPTYDDIALRAYFIGLDRETNGEKSDPLRDWLEAEQELHV